MSAIKNLLADGHALIAQLEEREHELAAAFRAWFDKLTGNVPELKAEAKTDAETAVAPVVAEAEHDAEHVAGEVAADVTDAASATPAAAGTTP